MGRARHAPAIALAIAVALTGARAAAQSASSSEADIAAAQALFEDAKRLMQAGKYDEACPKLVESQRIDPGGGTLLALGLCHEAQGKSASAWADFNLAISAARKDGRADREKTASEHVRALEPKLARVRIVVAHPASALEVKRDGEVVVAALWSTALPIDAGEHTFEAHAPGKAAWTKKVVIHDATTTDVEVPQLIDDPYATPTPTPTPTSTPTPTPTSTPTTTTSPTSTSSESPSTKTWAFVAGGAGVVLAAAGTAFGLSASSKWQDVDRACPGGTCTNAADVDAGKSAGRSADIATGLFVGSAVALVAAGVLFLIRGEP